MDAENKFREFHNNLRIMASIDGHELPGLPRELARTFVIDPYRAFLRMSDADAAEVWEAIKRRQPKPSGRRHKMPEGECATCDRERASGSGFHPPHDASPRCESGKRSHCSCDTCF